MPYKKHQFPAVVFCTGRSKSWHAGESHAVFDDPEKLPVRKLLSFSQTQVWRLRIHAFAKHRVPAAVIRMARRAVIRKMQPGLAHILHVGAERISRLAGA